jgi:hypothetical protein
VKRTQISNLKKQLAEVPSTPKIKNNNYLMTKIQQLKNQK